MTKSERAEIANQLVSAISACGRRFFAHDDRTARFEVDPRGRVWFIDAYSQRRIYTHYRYEWRGFTNGGTLRELIERLRDYIRTGERQRLNLGPWPQCYCDGDLWGYGDDMHTVRSAAARLGLVAPRDLEPSP